MENTIKTMNFSTAAFIILNSKFNVTRSSVESVFAKIVSKILPNNTIYKFLLEEKARMSEYDFEQYYGYSFNAKYLVENLLEENESIIDLVLRAAKTLDVDNSSFLYLEEHFKKHATFIAKHNYNKLVEKKLTSIFTDYCSGFRGEIIEINEIGGMDDSMPITYILKCRDKNEYGFYIANKNRLINNYFCSYKDAICYILSDKFYDAILKLIN